MNRIKLPTADAFRDVLVGVLSSQQMKIDDTLDMATLASIWERIGLRQNDMMTGVGSLWSSGVITLEESAQGENVLRLIGEIPRPNNPKNAIDGPQSLSDLASRVIRPFRIRRDSESGPKAGRRTGEGRRNFSRQFAQHHLSAHA